MARSPLPLVLWLGAAGFMVASGLHAANPASIDFAHFYRSAHAWTAGGRLYATHNLNPPTFVLLTAPLGWLSFSVARELWLAGSAVMFAGAVVAGIRARAISVDRGLWVLGAGGAMTSGWMAWQLGQVTWLLVALVTASWLSHRVGRSKRCGFWLGLAIAIKPPLALVALCLPIAIIVSAATVSAVVTIVAVAATGWGAWLDWLKLGSQIDWLGEPLNASLWSVAARIHAGEITGVGVNALGAWIVPITTLIAAMIWRTRREPAIDRRWTMAILLSVVGSPLGWAYYVPLAYLPAAASWRREGWIPIALFCLPLPILWPLARTNAGAAQVVGSLYAAAALAAWFIWTRGERLSAGDRKLATTEQQPNVLS